MSNQIITDVPPTKRVPQTFHKFLYSFAVATLTALPLRLALIGTMASTGTGVAGTVYEITEPSQTDALFGQSSELALMCRMAFACGAKLQKGPRLYAVGVAANAGGTAGVQTITAVGTATADGNQIYEVAGRSFTVGVKTGDVQNTIATAISNALKTRAAELPFVVTVAANVVTLTVPHKGINGSATDLKVTAVQQVAGSVATVATSAVAAGANDHQTALDALAPMPFDGVVFANHAAADITEINTQIATTWSYSNKRWRYYFIGESGTIGTATALASAANHHAVLIASMEGCKNTCGEMATALGFAAFSRSRPNANYDGLSLPLYPPAAATVYTPDEMETAIEAGLTPLYADVDPFTQQVSANVARIVRMVTTKTTVASSPFEVLRDLGVSRTGVYMAQQLDAAYNQRFSADADPTGDGALATEEMQDLIKQMVRSIVKLMARNDMLRNIDADLARLRVEPDDTAIGRFNVDLPYTVVVGLHQIAYVHRVQV